MITLQFLFLSQHHIQGHKTQCHFYLFFMFVPLTVFLPSTLGESMTPLYHTSNSTRQLSRPLETQHWYLAKKVYLLALSLESLISSIPGLLHEVPNLCRLPLLEFLQLRYLLLTCSRSCSDCPLDSY